MAGQFVACRTSSWHQIDLRKAPGNKGTDPKHTPMHAHDGSAHEALPGNGPSCQDRSERPAVGNSHVLNHSEIAGEPDETNAEKPAHTTKVKPMSCVLSAYWSRIFPT